MNTEYLPWFAVLVVVAGAVVLWLAIGDLPDTPTDPGADGPDAIGGAAPPGPEAPLRRPGVVSEPAGEDGIAGLA